MRRLLIIYIPGILSARHYISLKAEQNDIYGYLIYFQAL